MIYKNVASQKVSVFAYTVATGAGKTGDAANITAYLSKDWAAAAAITDTNPTEMDATNMPGWYAFDLTQAETNAEVLVIAPKSATSGVVVDQVQVFTQPTLAAANEAALIFDWETITGTIANRSTLNALRFLRNKWSVAAGTLTVTEEDDTTPAWTAAVTGTAGADPITSVDPA